MGYLQRNSETWNVGFGYWSGFNFRVRVGFGYQNSRVIPPGFGFSGSKTHHQLVCEFDMQQLQFWTCFIKSNHQIKDPTVYFLEPKVASWSLINQIKFSYSSNYFCYFLEIGYELIFGAMLLHEFREIIRLQLPLGRANLGF